MTATRATTADLPVGKKVTVTVAGSSANLGPGFDALGLAVNITDEVTVEVTGGGLTIDIIGEGADDLPRDESHLVVKAIRAGLAAVNASAPGLKIQCHNNIPQSRGLGSSAAAAVAGVAAANGLSGFSLDDAAVVQLASSFEGHPDNAAASVLGGAVVSWTESSEIDPADVLYKAVGLDVNPQIRPTAFVPDFHASTQAVRKVLPAEVSHMDARFNVARAAMMTVALNGHPELLREATRDRLHQPYRAEVLPVTAKWIQRLRDAGYAAYLSGAGPTCMVLSVGDIDSEILADARNAGLRVLDNLTVAGPVHVRVES